MSKLTLVPNNGSKNAASKGKLITPSNSNPARGFFHLEDEGAPVSVASPFGSYVVAGKKRNAIVTGNVVDLQAKINSWGNAIPGAIFVKEYVESDQVIQDEIAAIKLRAAENEGGTEANEARYIKAFERNIKRTGDGADDIYFEKEGDPIYSFKVHVEDLESEMACDHLLTADNMEEVRAIMSAKEAVVKLPGNNRKQTPVSVEAPVRG